eukprot:jgi/Ulvmu1/10413/UM062_0009.1
MGPTRLVTLVATVLQACGIVASQDPAPEQLGTTIQAVTTARQLQWAVREQVVHIVLTEHLDARGESLDHAMLAIQGNTKSIVGMCKSEAPEDYGLSEPRPEGACVLLVDHTFLEVGVGVHHLWLHRLYVIIEPRPDAALTTHILQRGGDLWLTHSVLQGRGLLNRAIDVSTADGGSPRLYTTDTSIVDMTGCDMPGVRCGAGAACTLNETAFMRASITGPASVCSMGTAVGVPRAGSAWLMNVTIEDNTVMGAPAGAKSIAYDPSEPSPALIVVEPDTLVWDIAKQDSRPAPRYTEAELERNDRFITANARLYEIQQEQNQKLEEVDMLRPVAADAASMPGGDREAAPDLLTPEDVRGGGDGSGDSSSRITEIALAATAAVVGLVALAVGAALIYAIIHRSRRNPPHGSSPFKISRLQTQRGGGLGIPESVDGANMPLAVTNRSSSYPVSLTQIGATTSLSKNSADISHHYPDMVPIPARSPTPCDLATVPIPIRSPSPGGLGPPSSRNYILSPSTTGSSAAAPPAGGTATLAPVQIHNPTLVRSYSSHSYPTILPWNAGRPSSGTYHTHSGALPQLQSDSARTSFHAPPESTATTHSGAHPAAPPRPSSFRSAAPAAPPPPGFLDRNGSLGTLQLPLLPPEGDTHTTTFDTTAAPPLPPAIAGADGVAVLDRQLLEHALDNMHACGELFMGKFEILGPLERRAGGQGIVQFALSRPSGDPVAIKFFLNRKAFDCEDALYVQQRLREMMPAVTLIHSNEDGSLKTHEGWFFPPCIVVERGESLDEWRAHVQPDFCTVVQVLIHVTERVSTLHAAGVVHRDLKPANVLWRPRHHAWTLIDYGCAADIASTTRLTFSMAYSPPEALCTLHAGAHTITSDPASDIWAIGVITYELVLGRPAFPARTWTREQLTHAALGERAYPWEEPNQPGRFRQIPEARALSGALRACLHRDPARRPLAAALGRRLNHLFDESGVTTESAAYVPADGLGPTMPTFRSAALPVGNHHTPDGAMDPRAKSEMLPAADARELSHEATLATPPWDVLRGSGGTCCGGTAWQGGSSSWQGGAETGSTLVTESTEVAPGSRTGRTRHIFQGSPGNTPPASPRATTLSPATGMPSSIAGEAEPQGRPNLSDDYRSLPGFHSTESVRSMVLPHAEASAALGEAAGTPHATAEPAPLSMTQHAMPQYVDVPPALMPTSLDTYVEHAPDLRVGPGSIWKDPPSPPAPQAASQRVQGSSFSDGPLASISAEGHGSFMP